MTEIIPTASRERELRRAVLASLADGDLGATRHELEVLADFWEEQGDRRAVVLRLMFKYNRAPDVHSDLHTTALRTVFELPIDKDLSALNTSAGPKVTVVFGGAAGQGRIRVNVEVSLAREFPKLEVPA